MLGGMLGRFIHHFDKHILKMYYVPSTLVDTEDAVLSKSKSLCSKGMHSSWKGARK
jgi:hypothetical protein